MKNKIYAIELEGGSLPLKVASNNGNSFLCDIVGSESVFTTPSISDALQILLGRGKGTDESPMLHPDLGLLRLVEQKMVATTFELKALPEQKELDQFKLICIDEMINVTIVPSSKVARMYLGTLDRKDPALAGEDINIIRVPKSQKLNVKLGDTLVAYSSYSGTTFPDYEYTVIDSVNIDKLLDSRDVNPEKNEYFVVRSK